MKIVAFGHKSRQGKDSAAKRLFAELKCLSPKLVVKRASFAGKLKAICFDLYAWAGLKPGPYYEDAEHEPERYEILPAIGKSPVQIWIEVGNKLREVYSNTWIDATLSAQSCDVLIISDLRFPNEAAAVQSLGGLCIKVIRPGHPGLDSSSDNALNEFENWDYRFVANDLIELYSFVDPLAEELARC